MDISQERIKQIIKEELSHAHAENDEGLRVKRHLDKIGRLAGDMAPNFDNDTDVPEWVQEKVAVVAAMLQSILDWKNGEEIR